jgi:hypothetical protein
MTFFDKKEEVISIELTPYGRHLLSLGKLKPSYYAFFDDDVIYNVEAAGLTETSADIKTRILEETPYMKPTCLFRNVNDTVGRSENYLSTEEIRYPSADNKIYFLQNPLGTCDHTATESPALKATFILNSSSAGSKFQINSTFPDQQIPQVDIDYDYTIEVKNTNKEANRDFVTNAPPEFRSKIFDDGTYYDIQDDNMILQLLEENGFALTDSFEIEVFKLDDTDSEKMEQLKFSPRVSNIKDDFIIDQPLDGSPNIVITPEYVDYYFNIFVDKEISINDLCKGIKNLQAQDIFIDLEVNCPDVLETGDVNIYRTRITKDDLEICDD